MADIQLVNYSAVATGSTSLTISKPTGTLDGHIMVMAICVHDLTNKGSLPAGWTRFREISSTNGTGFLAWKRASGEGTSYSITGLTDSAAGFIVSFANCIPSGDPIHASTGRGNASGATGTAGITTTVPNCMILSVACIMDNLSATAHVCATNPTSMTQGADGGSNTGSDTRASGAHALKAATGATGASSYTVSSFENVGLLCAIIPAPPAANGSVSMSGAGSIASGGDKGAKSSLTLTGTGSIAATGTAEITSADTVVNLRVRLASVEHHMHRSLRGI